MGPFSYMDNEQHNFYYRPIYLLQMGGGENVEKYGCLSCISTLEPLHLFSCFFSILLYLLQILSAYYRGQVQWFLENGGLFSFIFHGVALS